MSDSDYTTFLTGKRQLVQPSGFTVAPEDVNPKLFRFQADIVRWALRLGKAAIFAERGLGKTAMELEWSRLVVQHTSAPVLVLTPLAVAHQHVSEGVKFGIEVKHVQDGSEVGDAGIYVTNYDRLHRFDVSRFAGVALDESSILKHYSKTFFGLTNLFENTPFRLCGTATPAPNDHVELGNHAMFLGVMHFKDMMARWFVGEGDVARVSRLRGHAAADFWRWLTSWAVCISHPRDLGMEYDLPDFDLPGLDIIEHRLRAPEASIRRAWDVGQLLPDDSLNSTKLHRAKRESLTDRVAEAQAIVADIPADEPVALWCDTDYEADALKAAFPEAIEVRGSHSPDVKEKRLEAFSEGRTRMIITKPSVAGFGLNWQHCQHTVFVGVSYSFEELYQALGRFNRYGQKHRVKAHLIYASTEGDIRQALDQKEKAFKEMQTEMNAAMRFHGLFRDNNQPTTFVETTYGREEGQNWVYLLGDCVEVMRTLPPACVDLTVTSIPFSNLYVYSDKEADVGNAKDKAEFFAHMEFVIRENLRITRPGRCCAVHVKDLPLFKNRDGVMGIDPFSDDVTAAYRRAGWIFLGRVTVEKDPVIEMQKTNSHGLLFKNWKQKAEILRPGLPDYVLFFQAPGDGDEPITHDARDLTYYGDNPPSAGEWLTLPSRGTGEYNTALPVWQRYANPNWSDVVVPLVWADIDQTDVLNYLIAKTEKDSRHICPLQLGLIARVIHWKSNPGDVVFDPFGGIASTGYKALEMNRRFVGIELKPEYHTLGTKYLKEAELLASQPTLWDFADGQQAANE